MVAAAAEVGAVAEYWHAEMRRLVVDIDAASFAFEDSTRHIARSVAGSMEAARFWTAREQREDPPAGARRRALLAAAYGTPFETVGVPAPPTPSHRTSDRAPRRR